MFRLAERIHDVNDDFNCGVHNSRTRDVKMEEDHDVDDVEMDNQMSDIGTEDANINPSAVCRQSHTNQSDLLRQQSRQI